MSPPAPRRSRSAPNSATRGSSAAASNWYTHFGREIIEVATFRAHHPEGQDDGDSRASSNESGRILRDNVYGSLEDDAQRRDFTINALYFDVTSERCWTTPMAFTTSAIA